MIIFALALAAPGITLPSNAGIYCRASSGETQPVQRTDYGRLTAAFQREFRFRASLAPTSEAEGVLVFRGGRNNAETISYTVKPYDAGDGRQGIELQSMRVRLAGARETLSGDDMCWRTFGIVNAPQGDQ